MQKSKTTQTDILEACWRVLHRDGYYHTSLATLAAAAGLGKPGLLHHFGSKENLMRAVIDFAEKGYRQYVLSVAAEGLPVEQKVEKLLRRQNRLARIEGRGCFFGNVIVETAQQGLFNAQITPFFDDWQQTFARMLSGHMPPAAARDLAYRTMVAYQGAATLYKLTRDDAHLERYVSHTLQDLQQIRHDLP